VAKLSCHAVDVLSLGELRRPFEALALLRSVRAGEHERVHPNLPVITLGAGDELSALRAYERQRPSPAGRDGLCPAACRDRDRRAYVLENTRLRHLHAGEIDIDQDARTVTVAGYPVHVSRLEFELLAKVAGVPTRLFSKHELARCIWRGQQINQRTVDSHICRLRTRLTKAGADQV
jgi:DNA-binding response OmpR family regulator